MRKGEKIKVYVRGAGVTSEEDMVIVKETLFEIIAATDEYSSTEYNFNKKTGKCYNQSGFGFSWSIDPVN